MAPMLSDGEALVRLKDLNARAELAIQRCGEREAEIADLRQRQNQLRERLVQEQVSRPEDLDSELADALVNDPQATLTISQSIRAARNKSVAQMADHETLSGATVAAIAKLEAKIGESEAALAREQATADEAWRLFVTQSYEAMLEELRDHVRALADGPLAYLLGLADARELDRAVHVISGNYPKLTEDSLIKLRTFGSPVTQEVLFDLSAGTNRQGCIDRRDGLERFRARLAAASDIER